MNNAATFFHPNDRLFSSNAGFDHDLDWSSSPQFSMESLQQQLAASGNLLALERGRHSEAMSSLGTAAVANEIAHMMQGRVVSYPFRQLLSIGDESTGRGWASDFCSLAFNELADWGDIRFYAPEMATAAGLPPQKHKWIEGSTSCSSGDIVPTTGPVEFERPLGQCSYTIPTSPEMSTAERNELERPRPIQHEQSSYSAQPGATNITSVDLYPTSRHRSSCTTSDSDAFLPVSSCFKLEPPDTSMFDSLQPSTSQKSRFYPPTLKRDRDEDSVSVENFEDIAGDFKVLGPHVQHNFAQEMCLSMSTSSDFHGEPQPRDYLNNRGKAHHFESENLNYLKLKQKPPRKYQRRRMDMKRNEAFGPSTPLDHVQRERQRRDIMSSKIAALEFLLPKGYKRDRVTIVFDAIQLVERLQQQVKDLQQRFHDAKLRRAGLKQSCDSGRVCLPKSIDHNMDTNRIVIKRAGKYMKPVAIRTQPARVTSGRPAHVSSITQKSIGSSVIDKENVVIEFRVHLDDNFTMQEEEIWKCRCRRDYLRTLISVVEEFQLDLISCNIIKLSGYFICSTGLKARTTADHTKGAAQFAVRLQSLVDIDVHRQVTTSRLVNANILESRQN